MHWKPVTLAYVMLNEVKHPNGVTPESRQGFFDSARNDNYGKLPAKAHKRTRRLKWLEK